MSARAARTRAAGRAAIAPPGSPPVPLARVPLDVLLAWFGEDDPATLARARKLDQEATVLERAGRHAMAQRLGGERHAAQRAAAKRASTLDLLDGSA